MFREMRRNDRAMEENAARKVLMEGEYGILSVLGDDNYPYGVPINYALDGDCIYIHGFLEGHKIDAVRNHSKVCFTVVRDAEVMPDQVSTNFTSVIVFGEASVLPFEEDEERQKAFKLLMEELISFDEERNNEYIKKHEAAAQIIRIRIEHISGKQRKIR